VEYLMSKEGGGAKRFLLLGTDYVYPRTTNKILRAFLHSKGVADKDIMEVYTPFGHRLPDHRRQHQEVLRRWQDRGDLHHQRRLQRALLQGTGQPGLKATDVPVVAFSVGEEELRGIDTKPLVGHLAAWNYFMSVKNPTNAAFIKQWSATPRPRTCRPKDKPLTNDPMEATYVGIHMWAQAVEKAKSTDTDKVIAAMAGQTFKAPVGFTLRWTRRTTTCTSRCSSAK
jgi:urea transport system substrate-binding protein